MSHYEQYKETIKEVTKRNYRKRVIWVNEFLANQSCCNCGETETACLQFYPHDSKIRSMSKRKGLNSQSRQEVIKLIDHLRLCVLTVTLKLKTTLLRLYRHLPICIVVPYNR